MNIELLKAIIPFVAALLAAYFGLRTYFRQKEYELVKQRYLDQGVDLIAKDLDESFGIVSSNWKRFLEIARLLRDSPTTFKREELSKGFQARDVRNFSRVAHQRVGRLIGSKIIWQKSQQALGYVDTSNFALSHEFPTAIQLMLDQRLRGEDLQKSLDLLVQRAIAINSQQAEFGQLFEELNELAYILETSKLGYGQVKTIKHLRSVASISDRLNCAKTASIEN
jgi:hypothetical protein